MTDAPRVAVYAIALNERAFCERFFASCAGAELVLVADTGSNDGTVELLRRLGATVHRIAIHPWRFDAARNAALALLPQDVDLCIALDMDEVLAPGWRAAIDRAWQPYIRRLRYTYTWSRRSDGSPGVVFLGDKVHARFGYQWRYPCHETLEYFGGGEEYTLHVPELKIDHLPDRTKPRMQYLALLELGVREYPASPRAAYYYGRELYFRGRWEEAGRELELYLGLPQAIWDEERSQAMVLLSRCAAAAGQPDLRLRWALRAVAECSGRREAWCELARAHHERRDWEACYAAATCALRLDAPAGHGLEDEAAWGALPHDLAALAAYNLGLYGRAFEHGSEAARLEPDDARIGANLRNYFAPSAAEPKVWGERSIVYYASFGGEALEPWSPRSLEFGIGGSETAVIELARQWAARGYEVTVFGDPRGDAGTYAGVVYRPWHEINWSDTFNILILWRSPHLLDRPIRARRLFVDLHDVPSVQDWPPRRMKRVDRVFFKSQAHRAMLPAIPEEKAAVIGNGV